MGKPIFLQIPFEPPKLPSSSRDTEEIFPTSSPEQYAFWTSSISESEGPVDDNGAESNAESNDAETFTPQVKNDTASPSTEPETEPESGPQEQSDDAVIP